MDKFFMDKTDNFYDSKMKDFYDKKQKELNEEIEFLMERKRDIKSDSHSILLKVTGLLEELRVLKCNEDEIIKRLLFLNKSELDVYGINIVPRELNGAYWVPSNLFFNKTKDYVNDIKNQSEEIIDKDDENE